MSCSSKRKRRQCKPSYRQLHPDTGCTETVRRKLENIEQYQPLDPQGMREKIKDLTEMERLKDWFDNDEGEHTETMRVYLCVSPSPCSSVGEDPQGHKSKLRRRFEQFCNWGINREISLKINNTILKWSPTGLIEPHLEAMHSGDYRAASSRLEESDQHIICLGKSKQLNELLQVIMMYNQRYYFHPSSKNSTTFVKDALKALGIGCPPNLSLVEDYEQKIKSLKSYSIPDQFENSNALSYYVNHNLDKLSTNIHDLEYIYYMCIVSYVTSYQKRDTGATAVKGCSDIEYCLQDLDSTISQARDDLIFNQFWFQLPAEFQH